MPLAREVVQDLAVEHGACIRPIQLRRTQPGYRRDVDQVLVPVRAHPGLVSARPAPTGPRRLRAGQCREGWHLEDEPDIEPRPGHR